MKHKWEQTSGMNYRCSRCKEMDSVQADWCDAGGVNAELARIAYRNDCKGVRRKSRAKPKVMFSRRELFKAEQNHGGYLSGSCALCGNSGWDGQIEHHKKCVLVDPDVTHVKLIAVGKKVKKDGKRKKRKS